MFDFMIVDGNGFRVTPVSIPNTEVKSATPKMLVSRRPEKISAGWV